MSEVSSEELIEFLYIAPVALLKCDRSGEIRLCNPKCVSTFLALLNLSALPNFIELLTASDKSLVELIHQAKMPGEICRDYRVWIDAVEQSFVFSFDIHLTGKGELLVAFRDVTQAVNYEQELDRLAKFDDLTNLYNRKYFIDIAEREIERALRYQHPISLLIADLDHFKQINDNFGHLAGDTVLKRLGAIINTSVRTVDTAARFGGEEFCLLLPETDLENASFVAEKIRRNTETAAIEYDGERIQTTLSVGVAQLAPGESLEKLMNRADQALYSAKELGRNRVQLSKSE